VKRTGKTVTSNPMFAKKMP